MAENLEVEPWPSDSILCMGDLIKQQVAVYSTFDGHSSGYIKFCVPADYTIHNLLALYCSEKGIEVADDYVLSGKGNSILDPLKSLKEEGIENGDYIKLTKDDDNLLFAFGSWWVITLIAFVIGCSGIGYCLYFFFQLPVGIQRYGLVIDAGSTHSELFVFSWSKVTKQHTEDVKLIHSCIMTGGITEFQSHLKDLPDYFQPCIEEAKDLIPASTRPTSPLILAATGGMRILKKYDPKKVQLILDKIREYFITNTTFEMRHQDVFVASGQQEGLSGWTALNYLMEKFPESGEEYEVDSHASALDLGGASVQVTTEVSKDAKTWPTVNITIFNTTYKVYSKSFLCYGIGEAMHRYMFHLVQNTNMDSSKLIHNPCLAKGFSVSFSSKDFLEPCVLSNKTNAHLTPAINLPNKYLKRFGMKYSLLNSTILMNETEMAFHGDSIKSEQLYFLKGTSNVQMCLKNVQRLFDYDLCKESFVLGDCLDKKLVPPYKGELVGFSSIFNQIMPLLGLSKEGSLKDYKAAVMETCSKSNKELVQMHPNASRLMLEDLCFDSMYVYFLLKEGLGITPQRWKHILFTDEIREQHIVWAMGVMLNRTFSMDPQENNQKGMDWEEFSLLLALFSSILMTGFLFFWYSVKIKIRGNIYQRVCTNEINTPNAFV